MSLPLWGRFGGGFTFKTPTLTLPKGRGLDVPPPWGRCGGGFTFKTPTLTLPKGEGIILWASPLGEVWRGV